MFLNFDFGVLGQFLWGVLERLQVFQKGVDIFKAGIPGAHEAGATGADEVVEFPAFGIEAGDKGVRELGEDRIGLTGVEDQRRVNGSEALAEPGGTAVGMRGMTQPCIILQNADPRSAEKAHFGAELTSLFTAVFEFAGQFLVEKDDRFADGQADLGAAEAEHIDPCTPGDFFGGAI